jgi:tRNA nucleotidyltransferase (CCA-adding enzyme)
VVIDVKFTMTSGQCYLVGGAVRDRLLGRAVHDRDYVLVGADPAELLAQGFRSVGKDFPVFLHPSSQEEYALARVERKTAPGYQGFAFIADRSVTLEQDLARRDLTINAMAEDAEGRLIDPYGGAADLEARWLRHVSPAFAEDPVRVLRVARFAARYAPLGFRVASETRDLMRSMVRNGEVAHLVAERVWAETRKALAEPSPAAFLRTLRDCAALQVIFPELDQLYGVPQRIEFHPEFDTGVHQELALNAAAALAPGDELIGWCVLCHDLGKGLTERSALPRHVGHEAAGVPLVTALAQRLRVPTEYAQLAEHVCREHLNVHRLGELRAATVLALLERIDGFRKPERVRALVLACAADKRGRAAVAMDDYAPGQRLPALHAAAMTVSAKAFVAQGLQGEAIGEAVRAARRAAIQAAQQTADQGGSGSAC